jgi:uncharacterized protein YceK
MTVILTLFVLLVMMAGCAAIVTFIFSTIALILNLIDNEKIEEPDEASGQPSYDREDN